MRKNIALNDQDRASWVFSLINLLEQINLAEKLIVLACTALKVSSRGILQIDQYVQFDNLEVTYQQIFKRLDNRAGHYISAKMLASQYNIFEEPKNRLKIDITNSPEKIVALIRNGLNL